MEKKGAEQKRLEEGKIEGTWKKWGPYLTERQWGTVREDYSAHGDTWNFVTHENARSNAYRWGEEGIAGFCDEMQILCLAPAFWNGNDPILKERLFGLTNNQGNHGEDVKEIYFHLDSSPTHSYCKYLYKYPHRQYPYEALLSGNQKSRKEREYEILDTGIFGDGNYFDCFIEYAKADTDDILMRITVSNRGSKKHLLHVLPHIWFRNYWKHNPRYKRPEISQTKKGAMKASCDRAEDYFIYYQGGKALFCENETNNERIYSAPNDTTYVKDGINNHVIHGTPSVNPGKSGSKSAVWYKDEIEAGGSRIYEMRVSNKTIAHPWTDFDEILALRKVEMDRYYEDALPSALEVSHRHLVRSAFGGLLWTKQFYYYDVFKWLYGGPGEAKPQRIHLRNERWQHMTNRNIISMPDKWEYPWYAAWDLAFHATTFVHLDPDFAKEQLMLMLTEYYMHPNGQIPAYEWNFSDVNPPVHCWAVWEVFKKDRERTGHADYQFLETCFQKLLINFTWWINQKDKDDQSLFEGGFMGLDNIGVFDRNHMPKGIAKMQQADATSWMALFALNMLRISVELATQNKTYEESASKFFRQFLNIGWSMHNIGEKNVSLWDDEDAFYYDVVQLQDGYTDRLKVRSLVGIIPLFAVDVIPRELFENLKEFRSRAQRIIVTRPDLASLISRIEEVNEDGHYLFSIMRAYRLEHVLKRMLDEDEFLSEYGIRSLSKYHEKSPFIFLHHGEHRIEYSPAESTSAMFGGNSNWRGPIWLPINYLIIQSLRRFYQFYGPAYTYEFPTGSGTKLNLKEIAHELTLRLLRLFERDDSGKYTYHNDDPDHLFASDPHFRDHHLFYEFFHGETGRGMGASHQTGWTALIANLMVELESDK